MKPNGKSTPAVKPEANLPVVGAEDGAWGSEDIGSDDLIIPKILLMQPMSELVTDSQAKIGEFRSSLDKKLLNEAGTNLDLIVFGSFKTWLTFKDGEYVSTEKMTPENINAKTEEIAEADGGIITRDRVLNFYCLSVKDIKAGEVFPYVLSCRRTSYTAGKTIATHIKKLQMFKKPSAAKVFTLKSRKETNDKGTFFVQEVELGRDTTEAEMKEAYAWYQLLAKSKVKIDDSDLTKDTDDATNSAPTQAAGSTKTAPSTTVTV